ncbi:MAG: tRNA-dihydrouridine synthase [Parcubacteria group bacterium GW2011_GWC1_45_14]|nr:MAG: tRNA-dihydrouridine synthase [Candidatus Moranbacteria bacterium GW2011_GWC2_45_10]KKT93424.1 MAG: tRNA-dihydrouridine synthase [Parcubacteria group bacterium GW2011_GWC1_45_14]
MAPMADVTDFAFRQMFAKYGAPDVFYTEFVSADGLASEEGRKFLSKELRFSENERPIVAQIFGAHPENIKIAAKLVADLGFDGLDINMGCPDKAVIKQGAGAALIRTPELAREVIRAAKEGAPNIPVSVKTRIGFNKIETEQWISQIVAEKPDCLIVHGRTKKEMSEVDAHWDEIAKAAEIAREAGITVVGNGDLKSLEEGIGKAEQFGLDGIMVGRGIFGKPWFFNREQKEISLEKRLEIMLEHTELFEKEMVGVKGFHVMKKHYKAYVSGFSGAKELRVKLMEAESASEVRNIVKEYLSEIQ